MHQRLAISASGAFVVAAGLWCMSVLSARQVSPTAHVVRAGEGERIFGASLIKVSPKAVRQTSR